jgi:cytochrome P450
MPAQSRPVAAELTTPLTDPEFYAGDPHPVFTRLRHEAPLAWDEERGFWAVSRHADVLTVSTDPDTYCSRQGILLQDIGAELPEIPGALLYFDPPDHTRYRKLVQPGFSPSRMRAMEVRVRERARRLLDAVDAGQSFDVVATLTVPFPLLIISELLGIPDDDWPRFYEWSEAFIAAADGGREQSDEVSAQTAEAVVYILDAIADRKANPRDDLISFLATVEVEGEQLNDDELLMFIIQLLVAGNETTRNMLTGGLLALADNPDQWSALRDDRTLVVPAIEEMLRWTSSVISFLRTATTDAELAGQSIRKGDPLLLLYASANRDETVFGATADQFLVDREPNHHLAFGFGTHFCLGAMLARIEGRVLLEELLDRFGTIERAGEVERTPSTVIAGVLSAPLVFTS